jgi:hypothetical protein
MPQVGFERAIPVFKQAKTVHALDRAVTVIDTLLYFILLYFTLLYFTLLYFTLLYFTLLYFTLLYSK